ncbi:hypothetical protein MICA_2086 [Micavibrio aeruginosavorus ARL-13]|uniref:Uncharacterized protein n=1 Tax=Micavibrio aeruginosavorus (strain ARL-13) TaxID=856793 RepID=G2KQ25_MICAA|nr:hypothetical protein MICA_2086 [Micavibrio aeruginosavorus ARL-13]
MGDKQDVNLTEDAKTFLDGLALKHMAYSTVALALTFAINTCSVKEEIQENTKAVEEQTRAIQEQTRALENKKFIVPALHAR